MGSPQNVTSQQYAELEKAGKLKLINRKRAKIKAGWSSMTIQLSWQTVKLFKLSW